MTPKVKKSKRSAVRTAATSGRRPKVSTLVVLLLDETGSMHAIKDATISSFNECINSLKKDKIKDDCLFSLATFNTAQGVTKRCSGVPISKAPLLTHDTYAPDACTQLYDAIGDVISATDEIVKSNKKHTNVLFIIQTDGQENSSQHFTSAEIFKLIDQRKKDGWSFVFLGADQDAWVAGGALGIDRGSTLSYSNTPAGNQATGVALSAAIGTYRFGSATRGTSLGTQCNTIASVSDTDIRDGGIMKYDKKSKRFKWTTP